MPSPLSTMQSTLGETCIGGSVGVLLGVGVCDGVEVAVKVNVGVLLGADVGVLEGTGV